ncbi:hypothetical protein P4O66_001255 [Electrophorus voltai]|uniref:ERCC4 domain-containing protein n=1 Tax=Electrophorus voltai TaxID=2609070 RepID=A0AAD8ZAV8_9TELE|nr:hypothetical protein P4O66_001255 [Electrophorus voltai]
MSCLRRARTWEISDSEEEGLDLKDTEGHLACVSVSVAVAGDEPHVRGTATTSAAPLPESSGARTGHASVASATRSTGPGRKRRTRAEERKIARETLRLERERAKEEKRRRRREEVQHVKSLQPENCMRSLTVRVHPVLLQESGCDVLLACLDCLDCLSCIEDHALTHSISWRRRLSQVEEDQVLMVFSQEEFIVMVTSIKESLNGESEGVESLFQPLSEYLKRTRGTVISLLVTGQSDQSGGSKNYDDGPRSQLGLLDVDIEEVLVYLQLCRNVSVHFVFGWQEVTDHVCAITKALSKRPFKAACAASVLGFCVDGSWAGGVQVARDGRGLAKVWLRQIQQLNRVSVVMATAVTTAYPSPHLLLQSFSMASPNSSQANIQGDA